MLVWAAVNAVPPLFQRPEYRTRGKVCLFLFSLSDGNVKQCTKSSSSFYHKACEVWSGLKAGIGPRSPMLVTACQDYWAFPSFQLSEAQQVNGELTNPGLLFNPVPRQLLSKPQQDSWTFQVWTCPDSYPTSTNPSSPKNQTQEVTLK